MACALHNCPHLLLSRHARLAGATEFQPWQGDVPITLRVKARLVPQWQMDGASAGAVPPSPVTVNTPETTVELIPYGATRLRVSEFPLVARGK